MFPSGDLPLQVTEISARSFTASQSQGLSSRHLTCEEEEAKKKDSIGIYVPIDMNVLFLKEKYMMDDLELEGQEMINSYSYALYLPICLHCSRKLSCKTLHVYMKPLPLGF